MATFSFTAPLWRWSARSTSWFFVSLPEDDADAIDAAFGGAAAGFGSIKVAVTIGSSTWQTSIFPSKEEATYVLPIKKAVRTAEGLDDGSTADVTLTVLVI
ncbi:DUF1905 domain-containing protein [Euzebya tangerina]|uniref:DUF1905 domain-containing protein n=1 Tax=Euzebya tangerina TaxID=591198 RepID=UPI000E31BD2A|nr:DUF1905 domain-containing protein [Euzebya tangerina]